MGPKSHSQSVGRESSSCFTQRSKERKSNETLIQAIQNRWRDRPAGPGYGLRHQLNNTDDRFTYRGRLQASSRGYAEEAGAAQHPAERSALVDHMEGQDLLCAAGGCSQPSLCGDADGIPNLSATPAGQAIVQR